MADIPMILCIDTDFGTIWSVAGQKRVERAKPEELADVKARIHSIATRWAFRSWCLTHPLEDLIVNIVPQDTPLLSLLRRG